MTKPTQEKCGQVNSSARQDLNSVDWAIKLLITNQDMIFFFFDE